MEKVYWMKVFHLLQQEKNTKWKKMSLTAKKLFEDILSNADNFQKNLTVKEVEIISDVYIVYKSKYEIQEVRQKGNQSK